MWYCWYLLLLLWIVKANVINLTMKRVELTHEERMVSYINRKGSAEVLLGESYGGSDQLARALEARMSLGTGVHTIEAYVSGQKRVLIVDTGSGDTAFPCTNCQHCGQIHANPAYTLSSTAKILTCSENNNLGLQHCSKCDDEKCVYGQKYVEGSHWLAKKVQDQMTFGSPTGLHADIVFGCIYEEYGAFEEQEADGILGMARDLDSVFLQFYREGVISSRLFSQCISKNGGSMAIGGVDMSLNQHPLEYTPLRETGYKYWTVSMRSLTVGGTKVPVDASVYNAGRGCVLDSGTTFIYVPQVVEEHFTKAWTAAVGEGHEYSTYVPGKIYTLTHAQMEKLPEVCFILQNEVSLCIKARQYMKERDISTLRVATIFFRDFAHATIIGASALENHNIVYDMENGRIGIAKANCDNFVDLQKASLALDTDPDGDKFKQIQEWNFGFLGFLLVTMSLAIIAIAINHGERSDVFLRKEDQYLIDERNCVYQQQHNQS